MVGSIFFNNCHDWNNIATILEVQLLFHR